MPYINQMAREELDEELAVLIYIMKSKGVCGVGECNYVITTLLKDVLDPSTYTEYNSVIGVLECAKLEFYRRAVSVYEDKKIQENGDVYT
jgi:hypothetical protein